MDSWAKEHVDLMLAGGNQRCQDYLAEHGGFPVSAVTTSSGVVSDDNDDDIDIEEKYASEAAQDYKEFLKECSTGRIEDPVQALDETESSTESDGSGFEYDDAVKTTVGRQNAPTTIDSSARSSLDDSQEEEEKLPLEDEAQVQGSSKTEITSRMSLTLDGWFSHRSSVKSSEDVSLSVASSSYHKRRTRGAYQRSLSSASSASAPTITYMGRSFSADGSDDSKLLSKHLSRMRRKPDVTLLADLADQEEHIARESVSSSWSYSIPANHFSADKKVEPFASEGSLAGGSLHRAPFSSLRSSRRPTRHQSMRQKLAYTDADVLQIAQNDQEFARLKAGLKSKGAVTNEMLKQKLYAFVANSKVRRSSALSLPKPGTVSNDGSDNNRRNLKASKSEDLSLLRSYTIHSPNTVD